MPNLTSDQPQRHLPLAACVAHIVFLLFLRQLSRYLRRNDLEDRARFLINVIIGMAVTAGMLIVVLVGAIAVQSPLLALLVALMTWVFLLVVLVLAIVCLVCYAMLLLGLRNEILRGR